MGKCRGVDDARVPPLAKFLHVLCSTTILAGGRASLRAKSKKHSIAKHILLSSFRTNYCPRHCAVAKSLIFVFEVFAAAFSLLFSFIVQNVLLSNFHPIHLSWLSTRKIVTKPRYIHGLFVEKDILLKIF